jgi:hypothetical protein
MFKSEYDVWVGSARVLSLECTRRFVVFLVPGELTEEFQESE